MHSKIYAIYWWDLDVTYIGQTCQPMRRRISEHNSLLAKGTHYNKKVQDCFNLSKNYSFIVLEVCAQEYLDILEIWWISEFNSTNRVYGANRTSGGHSAGKGVNHSNSKYSKNIILKTFSLILKEIPVPLIVRRLGIDRSLVYGIKDGRAHTWLGDEYPEKYTEMLKIEVKKTHINNRVYPDFMDKYGIVYSGINNLSNFLKNYPEFANNYTSVSAGLSKVLRGERLSYNGFRLVQQ